MWIGQSVSLIGDGIYLVAIAWLVYDIDNRPSALGLVGVAWTLPMVMTLLVSGVITDRFERRLVLVASNLMRFAGIAGIAALELSGVIELWHVVALVVVYGVGEALFQPAFTAIVPSVVPREELLQANALKELVEPLGQRFAGPALGGLLIGVFGVGTAFAVDAATFAICAVSVGLMTRIPRPKGIEPATARGALREFADGMRYVRARPWLWATLVAASLALLCTFGPMEVLLSYIIKNEMDSGAGAFGAVLTAGGVGSIFAALAMSRFGLRAAT